MFENAPVKRRRFCNIIYKEGSADPAAAAALLWNQKWVTLATTCAAHSRANGGSAGTMRCPGCTSLGITKTFKCPYDDAWPLLQHLREKQGTQNHPDSDQYRAYAREWARYAWQNSSSSTGPTPRRPVGAPPYEELPPWRQDNIDEPPWDCNYDAMDEIDEPPWDGKYDAKNKW